MLGKSGTIDYLCFRYLNMETTLTSVIATGGETLSSASVMKLTGTCQLVLLVRNGRKFIFKALRGELAGVPQYQALLRKEYDIAITLDHPNILRCLNFESLPGFGEGILMEWIDGMTLGEWLATDPPQGERAQTALSLARALEYAHAKAIAHRDLKPDNVMITHSRHDVKLIDFGLADAEEFLIMKRSAATRAYGAPEQLEGTGSDARSDVYSFGKMLMLMNLPARYGSLARRCMNEDPAHRPSMSEVVRRMERLRSPWSSPGRRLTVAAAIVAIIAAAGVGVYRLMPKAEGPSEESKMPELLQVIEAYKADEPLPATQPLTRFVAPGDDNAVSDDEDDDESFEKVMSVVNTIMSILPPEEASKHSTDGEPSRAESTDSEKEGRENILEALKILTSMPSLIDD